ncbi:GTP cyclohydrolase FolE2 [Bacterioplanoides sp.]|uniref:GTP cyclohydrolase FolE2 n=1 Tax=Bacterioplanoides sp. TaxID=2066072 RepID=UPI003B00E401
MFLHSEVVKSASTLSDVASTQTTPIALSLNWVGMDQIDVPVNLTIHSGQNAAVNAKVNCYVSLDNEQAKGIHMSRLYRLLNRYAQQHSLTPEITTRLLDDMILSHQQLSCDASFSMSFDLPLNRPALLSDNSGWKSYPVEIVCQQKEGVTTSELKITVPYSSTCPCSASLSRQLLADKIRQHFSNHSEHNQVDLGQLTRWIESSEGSVATPHSQRSYAYIKVRFQQSHYFPIVEIINAVEHALKTPVQTAVKREDEQEFARLNGTNLMFCEDAARRLKQTFMQQQYISDYWLKVEHQESLHPHNAVAIAVADVPGGFQPHSRF